MDGIVWVLEDFKGYKWCYFFSDADREEVRCWWEYHKMNYPETPRRVKAYVRRANG